MSGPFWPVLRAMLNTTFGLSALRWRYFKRRERLWEAPLLIWGIGTLAVMLGYGGYRLLLSVTEVGASLGQPEIGLGLAVTAAQALVLLMGFFMVVSAFYFARDLQILVPLPVKPGHVITAKFLTLLIGEYATILVIYLPAVAAYATVVPFGPSKWIAAVLVFLVLPVAPLAIISLVTMVFMRSINRRQRDLLFYAGSLILFAAVFAWQFAIARAPTGNVEEFLYELISSRLGLLRVIAQRFPPAFWATLAIHSWPSPEGLLGMLATIGVALVSVVLIGYAGERLYYRGLIGGEEVARRQQAQRRTRRATAAGGVLLKPVRRPFAALFWREWTILLRTPVWVVNNLVPLLIMPVFFLVVSATQQGGLSQILDTVAQAPAAYTYVGLGIAAYLMLLGGIAGLGATSVSREGPRLWISRVIPQPAARQIAAKLAMALSAVLASSVPVVVAVVLLLRPPPIHILGGALVGVAGTVVVTALGLRVDILRPMLRWKDPREPVKTNLNAIISMGIAGLVGLIGFGIARFVMLRGHEGLTVYLALAAAGTLGSWAVLADLRARSERAFARLEV